MIKVGNCDGGIIKDFHIKGNEVQIMSDLAVIVQSVLKGIANEDKENFDNLKLKFIFGVMHFCDFDVKPETEETTESN